MTLTDAQRETIRYFGLEVVNKRECKAGEWILNGGGNLYLTTHASKLNCVVVVRPPHTAKVAELEANLRSADEINGRLLLKIESLGSELAPIMAMKVGSWQWAMVQLSLGKEVVNKWGCRYRLREGKIEHATSAPEDSWTPSLELHGDGFEPYTLLPTPEPEPTAAEFCAIIEEIERTWQSDHCTNHGRNIKKAMELVARVKRKEGGG